MSTEWTLNLLDGTFLRPARGASARWKPLPHAKKLQSRRCHLHTYLHTQLPSDQLFTCQQHQHSNPATVIYWEITIWLWVLLGYMMQQLFGLTIGLPFGQCIPKQEYAAGTSAWPGGHRTSWRSFLKQDYAAVAVQCWQLKPVNVARMASPSPRHVALRRLRDEVVRFGATSTQPVWAIPSGNMGADTRRSRSRDQMPQGYITSDDENTRRALPTWRQYRQWRQAHDDEPIPLWQSRGAASSAQTHDQPGRARSRAPWQAEPDRRARRSARQRTQPREDRNRRARQQLRRRYYRHRLNSSDDVVGIESVTESTDSDRPPRWVDSEEHQAGFGRDEWMQQQAEEQRLASFHDDAEDGHNLATAEGRRARRLEHLAYRHQDDRSPVRDVALGANWLRVGDRWRFAIPSRALPPEFSPMIVVYLDRWQVPISPSRLETVIYYQHPHLRRYAQRLSMVEFTSQHGGRWLSPHVASLGPWISEHPAAVEAVPSFSMGAGEPDPVGEAFRKLRQSDRTARAFEPKVLRTILRAQPKVAQRILATPDSVTHLAILQAAAKRAGLGTLVNGPGVQPEQEAHSKGGVQATSAPSSPPSGPSPVLQQKTRWNKRSQDHSEPPPPSTGWRTVRRNLRSAPTWKLTSEWTVPVVSELHLNTPGVMLCEDTKEAMSIVLRMKRTSAPSAIVSRQRLQLPDSLAVQRTAFHMKRVHSTSDADGKQCEEVRTIPVIGHVYQLGGIHSVGLKQAPQLSTFSVSQATVVVRVLTAAQWCPEGVWTGLQKGKAQALKTELIRLLQVDYPSHVTSVYDIFRLEQQGCIIGACIRIAAPALASVLAISGSSWVFVHPLSQQAPEFPAIWNSEPWPQELAPLRARASDIGAMSLALGDRHIGFRCRKGQEDSVRMSLGVVPKESWILSGIPVSFSSAEANSALEDMGVNARVQEHTRRVMRNTQSWVVHLDPGKTPAEDTLHLSLQGKDYYVTLVPAKARSFKGPIVKQLTKARRKDAPTYAQVVHADFPPLSGQGTGHASSPKPPDRIAQLERLVQSLIGLIAHSGIDSPSDIQADLHGSVPSHSHQHVDNDNDDNDSNWDDDMHDLFPNGDEHDHDGDQNDDDDPDMAPAEGSSKRQRTVNTPAAGDVLRWSHAQQIPFQHLVWGRVKRDGNCLWRSIASLINANWETIKQQTLAQAHTLSDAWCDLFHTTPTEYQALAQACEAPNAWGNEVALALLAKTLQRQIVVVSTPVVWVVSSGECLHQPLIIRLANRHFDPLQQAPTSAILSAIRAAHSADTAHLHLAGGATTSQLASWNLSAMDSHASELWDLKEQVVALQEVGCSLRSQQTHSRIALRHDVQMIWGAPTPLSRSSRKFWRLAKGAVPGVALACPLSCRAAPLLPRTPAGHSLWRAGRLVMATLVLGNTRTVIGSVYILSGEHSGVRDARASCMHQLVEEVQAHHKIPMFLAGDWNVGPGKNVAAALLAQKGWTIPLHVNPGGGWDAPTFVQGECASTLDYWILSPAASRTWVQTVRERPGHAHRSVHIRVPQLSRRPPERALCPPVKWKFPPVIATCSPVDWHAASERIQDLLRLNHIDLAWHLWIDFAAQEVSAHSEVQDLRGFSDAWFMQRTYHSRVQKDSEVGPRLTELFKLARRLLDFGKWGGDRVRGRIERDYPALAARFSLPLSQEEALRRPVHASEVIFTQAKALQEEDKKTLAFRIRQFPRSMLQKNL